MFIGDKLENIHKQNEENKNHSSFINQYYDLSLQIYIVMVQNILLEHGLFP